jgi:hypothetical protein
VYTVLAVAGIVLWRTRRAALVPLLYFAALWGIFLFFYAGSFNYGADDRFALMSQPAVAVLAGVGAWRFAQLAMPLRMHARATSIVVAVLVVQFLWYLPFVRAVGEEAWGARADVEFARTVAAELPANSMILTHNPNMFHLWGHNAAQASIAANEENYLAAVLTPRYAGGVFFHWNFWCNVADPVQQSFCVGILNRFPHTLVREYRERDYRYAFYRLDVPEHRRPPQ